MSVELRILVTGSRDWQDQDAIANALLWEWVTAGWPDETTLVSGACPSGADAMAESIASAHGWIVERHPADWTLYGKRAGFVRNQQMVDLGADIVLAFVRNHSRGASMTVDLACKAGLPVRVRREGSPEG